MAEVRFSLRVIPVELQLGVGAYQVEPIGGPSGVKPLVDLCRYPRRVLRLPVQDHNQTPRLTQGKEDSLRQRAGAETAVVDEELEVGSEPMTARHQPDAAREPTCEITRALIAVRDE